MSSCASRMILVLVTATMSADDAAPFRIATRRGDDRVTVELAERKVIFAIESPFGISGATIQRTAETWPNTVVLRFHLRGLENFEIASNKTTLVGSASLRNGETFARLWKDGQEDQPLDVRNPYWLDIRIVARDGEPPHQLPLQDGYFELRLPQALFADQPQSITVRWIDFYRN